MKNKTLINRLLGISFYALLSAVFIYGSWILVSKLFALIPNKIIEMGLTLISLPIIFYIWLEWFICRQKNG